MAETSTIEWTDATWNPITGCSVLSAGCKHCYAMRLAGTRMKFHWSRVGLTIDTKAGPVWSGQVRFNEEWLRQPLQWKRPRDIFVCAHADLFHEAVPEEWIDRVFAVISVAQQHRFQVLTKRSARMRDYFADASWTWRVIEQQEALGVLRSLRTTGGALDNVWLGVSVENDDNRHRLNDLVATPAAVRWVSAEPLLGPLDVTPFLDRLDWVVAGGESGDGARPLHPDWARGLCDQCAAGNVPFHFKQWGEYAPIVNGRLTGPAANAAQVWFDPTRPHPPFEPMERVGKKVAGRRLDGVVHDGMPA